MKRKIIEIMKSVLIGVFVFIVSLFDINGIFIVVAIPLFTTVSCYRNKASLVAVVAMTLASALINIKVIPLIFFISLTLFFLTLLILTRFKIGNRNRAAIGGYVFTLSLCLLSFFSALKTSIANCLFLPLIVSTGCYFLSDVYTSLKSKEKFSLTKRELLIMCVYLNVIFLNIYTPITGYQEHFVLLSILDYVAIMLDPNIGAISTLVSFTLLLGNTHFAQSTILMLLPLLFMFKQTRNNRFFGAFAYFVLGVGLYTLGVTLQSRIYELITLVLFILSIPNNRFIDLQKFIIEEKDYEIENYRASYLNCLNRNNQVQKVLETLEDFLKENKRLKKGTKEIILDDIKFLHNKLKEDEKVISKDNICNYLNCKKYNVISFKVEKELFNDYKIYLEIEGIYKNSGEVLNLLEDELDTRLEVKEKSFNFMNNSTQYYIKSKKLPVIKLAVSQRSKEEFYCGDSYATFDTANKRYLLISDGMGHGKGASEESSKALLLLKSFIELGMDVEKAIISCNALIYSKEKEEFNTLDLLEYDYKSEKFTLFKNGSGITYLKDNKNVDKIYSENLPLGILENIEVDKISVDDKYRQIVLTSDGVKNDLSGILSEIKTRDAKETIKQIQHKSDLEIDDDQTIVVISVIKT